MKVKSITDKISESLQRDIEKDDSSEDDQFSKTARVVHFDTDEYDVPRLEPKTDFRKRNVKLLSEQSVRYRGKIVSRKELDFEGDNGSDRSGDDNYSENLDDSYYDEEKEVNAINKSTEEVVLEQGESGSDEESSFEEEDEANGEEVAKACRREDSEIRKGVCVQNQLHIWERLLEMRIRTQKIMNIMNRLPSSENDASYASDIAKETTEKSCLLLKALVELKVTLSSQFSELLTRMKRPLQENSTILQYQSGAPPLKRIALELGDQHSSMRAYRNAVLLKWDDRTKLLTPGAGGKKKLNDEFNIVQKIESALLNRDILITKSHIIPKDESIVSSESTEQETPKDSNVYNDNDFYYQLLRELIEYKTSASPNISEASKQAAELQQLRKKMKKKVDTRASKGRKIRYTVHKKLINFMAPDDTTLVNWPEESKDELFKSLFAT